MIDPVISTSGEKRSCRVQKGNNRSLLVSFLVHECTEGPFFTLSKTCERVCHDSYVLCTCQCKTWNSWNRTMG